MAIKRRKPDPDGITTAQLAGTVGRHASRHPLDVDAALAELQEIAGGRADLLAEQAGITLGASTPATTGTSGSPRRSRPRFS
jgi:hypothetical protein